MPSSGVPVPCGIRAVPQVRAPGTLAFRELHGVGFHHVLNLDPQGRKIRTFSVKEKKESEGKSLESCVSPQQ